VNFIELASEPLKPTDTPISVIDITDDKKIKVTYADPTPDNGGSSIISYELAIDDGRTGNFTSVVGFYQNSMLKEFTIEESELIIKGRHHRLKYRAKNIVGWGPYSDEVSVLVAKEPSRPDRPYFLTF
jgi:hypothetical protein